MPFVWRTWRIPVRLEATGPLTLDKVKAGRRDEAERAALALGAEIEFFDAGDYPLRLHQCPSDRLIDHLPRT